jgi:hypothetical protein
MDYYKFIADEDELRFFWNYGIPPLQRNELYFVSLSARNKKLDEEERIKYAVGRSEMFAKQQIRHDSYKEFIKHIKRFEVRKDAYLTKSDVPYPEKVLVCYWNIVPIDAYKAMKDQMAYLTETLIGLSDSCLKGSKNGIEESFYKIKKSFDTCQSLFARNFGKKYWLDIDIDADNLRDVDIERIKSIFKMHKYVDGEIMIIKTGGGVHCLVLASKLKENPDNFCHEIENDLKLHNIEVHEIIRNKNEMIPLPGTYQYGEPVLILNKKDFISIDPFNHGEESEATDSN